MYGYGRREAPAPPPPPPEAAVTLAQARKIIREHRLVEERTAAFAGLGASPLRLKGCPGRVGATIEKEDGLYVQIEGGKRFRNEPCVALAVKVAKNKQELRK